MTRETIEIYPQDKFDQDAHIAEFLQTSAVYLGINAHQVMALSKSALQPNPAFFTQQEAQYAQSRRYE